MKKFVFIILILSLMVIPVFTGCSQVSQLNKLQAPWNDYEKFSYIVSYDGTNIGTMDMTFKRIKNTTVTINEDEFNFEGSVCTMQLNITEGENAGDSISSEVAFNTDFSPIASYKTTFLKGVTTASFIKYNTGKNKGTLTLNGNSTTFKHTSTAYDNEMLYLLVRASDLKDSKYSMSFTSPNNLEGKLNKISVTKGGTTEIITELGTINCNNFTISAEATYGEGVALVLSIAKSPILLAENKDSAKVITKIIEGKYTYLLVSATNTES